MIKWSTMIMMTICGLQSSLAQSIGYQENENSNKIFFSEFTILAWAVADDPVRVHADDTNISPVNIDAIPARWSKKQRAALARSVRPHPNLFPPPCPEDGEVVRLCGYLKDREYAALALSTGKSEGGWKAVYPDCRPIGDQPPQSEIITGQRIQLAMVVSDSVIKLFQNGKVYRTYEKAKDHTLSFDAEACYLVIGRAFYGSIGEVRLYNCALTDDMINQQMPGQYSGLQPLGHWTFDDGRMIDCMGYFPEGRLISLPSASAEII